MEEKESKIKQLFSDEKKKKILFGAIGAVIIGAVIAGKVFLQGGQEANTGEVSSVFSMDEKEYRPKPKPLTQTPVKTPKPQQQPQPKPVPKAQVKQEPQQEQKTTKDALTGKDLQIVKLDKEIEELERKKKILELRAEMKEIEKKLKEMEGTPQKRNEEEIRRLREEIRTLKGQIQRATAPKFVKTGRKPELSYTTQAILCENNKCTAVIRDGSGRVFTVQEGSVLPDGTKIVEVSQRGVYLLTGGQVYLRPPQLVPPKEEKEKETKTAKRWRKVR